MSLTTVTTQTAITVADNCAKEADRFILPLKFQLSPYKSAFSPVRSLQTRNQITYEDVITEYILRDPFTVALQCAIPFTEDDLGILEIGEVYIVADSTYYSSEFLLAVSQPAGGVNLQKHPSSVLLLEIVVHTPGLPILDVFNFEQVTHKGDTCTLQKLRELLNDGQGITTEVTEDGKLRISANFDYAIAT